MPSQPATPPSQRRVNRPKDKDDFLAQLVEDGPFTDYRDVLVFAAAFGWSERRRIPLASKSEPIRWETAANRYGTEALVNMIAAAETEDAEVLGPDRFDERLLIFEEYANGGLDRLQGILASEPRPTEYVLLELIQQVTRSAEEREIIGLTELADDL